MDWMGRAYLNGFNEECALDQYKNSTRCYSCGKQTTGVFNPAKVITELSINTGRYSNLFCPIEISRPLGSSGTYRKAGEVG